ncbi:MAG: DUF1338 family protein [Phycisphaerales bacterium]|jgi:uncharacterized glyoxalase superfamily metalloenzyme YdcJ|nr:DUF1338 family protein [Phycisphaerales bacterium]
MSAGTNMNGAGAVGSNGLADKVAMQHMLFGELSSMFGKEVPLYDKSLLVNTMANRAIVSLLERLYPGFAVSDAQLEKTSGERHGAIRIGRPDEYRWIGRFFAQFAMEPHNFYDMTSVGAKSQPIIATAFRSRANPEHRVFSSLLQTNWFDPETRQRIEALLAPRQVFCDKAKALIEKGERQGGLDWADAKELIAHGTRKIFKWTGQARDYGLYKALSDGGFKIAADIACFQNHHLNHLTPNTLYIDLYTSAMKHAMGELTRAEFVARGTRALTRLAAMADRAWMRLHFKHLTGEQIDALGHKTAAEIGIETLAPQIAERLAARLGEADVRLAELNHSGFKDTTEGPAWDTPVLLRQDSYKALTEAVTFTNPDGTMTQTTHTARFGEIEQRFYATTPRGRAMYDQCLAAAEEATSKHPGLAQKDFAAYEALIVAAFAPFPKTAAELLSRGLIWGMYSPTAKGLAAKGTITTTDARELVRLGYARLDGHRYEDFLPVSAAGIFASNLNQYGTKTTAHVRPTYVQKDLEDVLGREIINTDEAYRAAEAQSLLATYDALGLSGRLTAAEKSELLAVGAK